MQDLKR